MNDERKNLWYLAIIDDVGGAVEGSSILKMLQVVREGISFNYLYIYTEDFCNNRAGLTISTPEDILTLDEGIDFLNNLGATEWTNLLLYQEEPDEYPIWKGGDPLEFFSKTVTSIRACDSFICVYTPHPWVIEHLRRNYPITSVDKGPLLDMIYCE